MKAIQPNPTITNDDELATAIDQLIRLEQDHEANPETREALAAAVEAYEAAAGHVPEPPRTLRGILEVEMFRRRLRQRQLAELLDVTPSRLSELMNGKREMNLDFARRIYTRLHIPADVVLSLAS